VLLVAAGLFVYTEFFREEPAPYFASDEEHFLYGSVGTEPDQGVPYWIWLVLPRIFPEHLPAPGGYASIGVIGRDGHEMPIGLSKVTVGFPRVGINCAMCHAATFRAQVDDVPTVYAAAASHQTGEQEYLRFLIACASDPRSPPPRFSARSRGTRACPSSTACSIASRSFRARGARCSGSKSRTAGWTGTPTGVAGASTRSTQ
jgi:hypothetical protein